MLMPNSQAYATWVEIDTKAIENNTRALIQQTGVGLMAVVKANGYGHGAVESSLAAVRGGAKSLGVARVGEACALRNAGIDLPILILGYVPFEKLDQIIKNRISITVWDERQIQQIIDQSNRIGEIARVHLKLDTGMHRLGADRDHAFHLSKLIEESPQIFFEGVFTHLARADEVDSGLTHRQVRRFNRFLDTLNKMDIKPKLIHSANSAGALNFPESKYNMIRPGLAIYGLGSTGDTVLPAHYHPALSWKTVISMVKDVPPGRGISYGHKYRTSKTERIGTLPVGYADGFRRVESNQVLIRGKRCQIVGRVSMDQVMVNLDHLPDAREGDEVVIIGSQGKDSITAEEIAERWGTINYEVICGIDSRVPRVYYSS